MRSVTPPRTRTSQRIEELERLYWYTLEFGVVEEEGAGKAYGAGFLSSAGELRRLETDVDGPERVPFDIDEIVRTAHDPTDYQQRVFVAPSMEEMTRAVKAWCRARATRSERPTAR